MEQLFLTILNRAVTAGWLVLLVMVLRVVLKKAPRAVHYGLWAIVAVRLLWPGDLLPRAGVSLVPTTEPISGDVLTAAGTAVSGGLPAVGSPAGAAAAETAARTGQSLGHIAAVVWLVGMAAMALYLLSVRLPEIVMTPLNYLANMNTPLPTIVVGYQLSHANFGQAFADRRSWTALVLRLLVFPLLSIALCYALRVDSAVALVTVIAACTPPAALLSMFAQKFGSDTRLSSSMVSVFAAISVLTIPPVVGLAQYLMG